MWTRSGCSLNSLPSLRLAVGSVGEGIVPSRLLSISTPRPPQSQRLPNLRTTGSAGVPPAPRSWSVHERLDVNDASPLALPRQQMQVDVARVLVGRHHVPTHEEAAFVEPELARHRLDGREQRLNQSGVFRYEIQQ